MDKLILLPLYLILTLIVTIILIAKEHVSHTTSELQMSESYTGIYSTWNIYVDNERGGNDLTTGRDDPWNFGTSSEHPTLKEKLYEDDLVDWPLKVEQYEDNIKNWSPYLNPASRILYISGLSSSNCYSYMLYSSSGKVAESFLYKHEHIFLLTPIASGLVDNEQLRARYYELLLDRLEQHTDESIRPHLVYKHSYAGDSKLTTTHTQVMHMVFQTLFVKQDLVSLQYVVIGCVICSSAVRLRYLALECLHQLSPEK